MKIKKFIKNKNAQYELVLENDNTLLLYEETILEFDLLLSKEITDKVREKVIKYNKSIEAYYIALKYLKKKLRTKKEIINYLNNLEYSEESVQFACNKLNKLGYLNEKLYVSSFINDKIKLTNDGPNKILYDLSILVDDISLAVKELEKLDENFWLDRVNKILVKKNKSNSESSIIFTNKMRMYLCKLGYNTDLISKSLNHIIVDDSINFYLQADKIWNNLIKKDENNYKLKFIKKMYSKGYDIDMINEYIKNNEN